jgi:hypothetical protein
MYFVSANEKVKNTSCFNEHLNYHKSAFPYRLLLNKLLENYHFDTTGGLEL